MYKVLYQKKERGATVIIGIKNLLINSHRGWRYQWCCCCVQGVCCSQWYNLFIPLNLISLTLARALVRSLSRRYSITRLQDAVTLSPFSSHVAGERARKGRAQQAVLCSAQTRQQCERRCSLTQKSPNSHIRQLAAKH